jgi:hypothetical protein
MASRETSLLTFAGDPVNEHIRTTDGIQNQKPRGNNSALSAEKSRECWCAECMNRVTVAPDCSGEFGHEKACDRYFQRDQTEVSR